LLVAAIAGLLLAATVLTAGSVAAGVIRANRLGEPATYDYDGAFNSVPARSLSKSAFAAGATRSAARSAASVGRRCRPLSLLPQKVQPQKRAVADERLS
jgi:hypothetical protein